MTPYIYPGEAHEPASPDDACPAGCPADCCGTCGDGAPGAEALAEVAAAYADADRRRAEQVPGLLLPVYPEDLVGGTWAERQAMRRRHGGAGRSEG